MIVVAMVVEKTNPVVAVVVEKKILVEKINLVVVVVVVAGTRIKLAECC